MPSNRPQQTERRPRPHKEQPLNCPRCQSVNTKFCYYNNYSLSQPRYFCKTCRRYWTEGGSLRNVPIGGGSRKNKRHSLTPKPISSNSTSSSQHSDLLPQATGSSLRNPNPKFHEERGLHFSFNSADLGQTAPDFASAFGLQDLQGYPVETVYGGVQGEVVQESTFKRGFFPFEDLSFEQNRVLGGTSSVWSGFNGSW